MDGRARNETVWYDYIHMAFNGDYQGGKTTDQLLDQYGASVILMNGFDFKGHVSFLPAAQADPSQKLWKRVYHGVKSLIHMREASPGVQALAPLDALTTLEEQRNYNVRAWSAHIGRTVLRGNVHTDRRLDEGSPVA